MGVAGSHQEFGAPQLELLKQACHVFALDRDVKNEVANMKRALLRVLKVLGGVCSVGFVRDSRPSQSTQCKVARSRPVVRQ